MKAFIERTFPICEPFFEQDTNGYWIHPLRHRFPAAVVLSVCGFFDESAFEALSHYVNFLFGRAEGRLIAEIYRTSSQVLTQPVFDQKLIDILDATKQAGRELVSSMKINPDTMARIKQPIADSLTLSVAGDLYWKTCIAEGITPKTFEQKGMVPRPDSIETYMILMRLGFNSKEASEKMATLQFVFTGEVEGPCYFKIEKGTIETAVGATKNPDLSIESPFGLWMDIVTNKADGMQMFMEGKYQAVGDISLMGLFGR
jgi:putative sterol carrier protein